MTHTTTADDTRHCQDGGTQYRLIPTGLRQRTATQHVNEQHQPVAGSTELAGQSGVSDVTFHKCYQATSTAPLVACSATDQLQTGGHHVLNEINRQPSLPTSSHSGLSTSTYTAIIGQTVTYSTQDGRWR